MDPALGPSIIKQRCSKNLDSTVLRLLYDFFSLKNYVNVPVFRIWIRIR
jgi:hypothetical protein